MEDRRREALRQWLPALPDSIRRAGDKGLSVQQASRDTATVSGFQQALRNQRATLLQFAQLWPDEIRIEKRGTQNIMRAAPRAQEPAGVRPQEPDAATAVRPREPNLRLKPARIARPQETTLDRWRAN